MIPEFLTFAPNVPQELVYLEEDYRPDEDCVVYALGSPAGMKMRLASEVAAQINIAEIQPGESFFICKYWGGKRGEKARWSVWRAPAEEKRKAEEEESEIERQLRESIAAAQLARKAGAEVGTKQAAAAVAEQKIAALSNGVPAPAVEATPPPAAPAPQEAPALAATGTAGPFLVADGERKPRRGRAEVVPAVSGRLALRHILQFVNEELRAANQQWGADQVQRLVVTMLIPSLGNGKVQPLMDLLQEKEDADVPF